MSIQQPKSAFLSQLTATPNIYFGKYNPSNEPKQQKDCITVYFDTKAQVIALFDAQVLVGQPEKVKLENGTIPFKNGIVDKNEVKSSFRLPVFRSKSYALFLQKWTKSAGFLLVENKPFKPASAQLLMDKIAMKAV